MPDPNTDKPAVVPGSRARLTSLVRDDVLCEAAAVADGHAVISVDPEDQYWVGRDDAARTIRDELLAMAAAPVEQLNLFAEPGFDGEPTLWRRTARQPVAVLRRSDLPAEHRDLWDALIGGALLASALSSPPTSTPEEARRG